MRNFIIIIWLMLFVFFAAPVVVNHFSGIAQDQIIDEIQKEAEADPIQITAAVEEGNKAMYCFTAGEEFGVAVFAHYGENYSYEEGTISNGENHIDVSLDTGWDVHQYKVTDNGAKSTGIQHFSGSYRMYGIVAVIFAVITVIAIIYSLATRKRRLMEKKHGLRQ